MAESVAPGNRQAFIDWMKAVGMVLIVIGHVAGDPDWVFNAVSAPVYSKQLGVAFFVFIAGWSLAHNRRPRAETAYRRLFEILLFGLLCALLMSLVTWMARQDLAESNYLPLALGCNVFLNHFPANPTTWYIGMYLHLVLLWWWLMPRRLGAAMALALLLTEVAVRGLFIDLGRSFTAYMLVTNWLGVFLAGYLLANNGDDRRPGWGAAILLVWLGLLLGWRAISSTLGLDGSFPTRRADSLSPWIISAMVSGIYLANSLFAFHVFRRMPAPAIVRFIARHTLLIFILHMPLIYGLSGYVYALFEPIWLRKLAMVIVVFAVLGPLSSLIHTVLPTQRLQLRLWQLLPRRPDTQAAQL
jgi:fucose 4-O-acetylase-like acetyltransferase